MRNQRAIEGVLGDLSENWGWLLAVGIVFVVLGAIGLGITAFLTLVSVLYFGIMLIIGGLIQMIHAFKGRGWRGVLPSAITGFLYLVAGISVTWNPTAASTILTLLLALALIGIGFARIWMAVQHRGTPPMDLASARRPRHCSFWYRDPREMAGFRDEGHRPYDCHRSRPQRMVVHHDSSGRQIRRDGCHFRGNLSGAYGRSPFPRPPRIDPARQKSLAFHRRVRNFLFSKPELGT
jgi:uncharacterized membrane protein HdeD (DUF308 family)